MANNFRNILLLSGFNNYFNRVIKKYDDIASYESNSKSVSFASPLEINFNPADGVRTEVILNVSEAVSESDYLLVIIPSTQEIESRWFILDCDRTRTNQYKVTLKRDVIADNYNEIINSPCYIEKGTLNENDPLIFNSEGMSFNQIKKDEILLQDLSRVPWIVGYISRDYLKPSDNPENPTTDKTIKGRYNVNQSAAINSSELPWDFSVNPKIVGNTIGYKLKISSGSFLRILSNTWAGQTYTQEYPYTEETVLNYNSKGKYVDSTNTNNHPNASGGTIQSYSATSDFNFVSDNGKLINSLDVSDYISKKGLSLTTVPSDILAEQQIANATIPELLTYNNKIVKDGQRYYRLKVEQVANPTYDYNEDNYVSLKDNLFEFISSWNETYPNKTIQRAARKVVLSAVFDGVRITTEAITQEDLTVTIPIQEHRIHLNDGPYDMFAIPYGNIHLKKADIDCNKDSSLAIAFYAAAEMGSNVVYDLQLVPYCPCPEYISDHKILDENNGQEGFEYNYIKDTNNNIKSIMIWCANSSGTFNINKKIKINRPSHINVESGNGIINSATDVSFNSVIGMNTRVGSLVLKDVRFKSEKILAIENFEIKDGSIPWNPAWTDNPTIDDITIKQNMSLGILTINYNNCSAPIGPSSVLFSFLAQWETTTEIYENPLNIDIKVSDACDMYRLVSPNYNGQFEFSLAKNGGINYFNIDYNYKPFSPYIHINPDFNRLYGKDWNDARGLICGGDFSLPMVTSAWTDYQVANKNYQNIFDRQIQNMDVSNEIAKQQAQLAAISGTFTGTATGASTGAITGMKAGPYGAIIGAAVGGLTGGIASGVGGAMDLANLEKAQKEAKSFATDMYNFNLQNVQAIPYSLAKTSAFTYNNKMWPMIEMYSCTDQEKSAFINKLKYNGMTVMKIDNIANYISGTEKRFIKGQLIRLDDIVNDSHMAYSIYEEISQGVYL